MSQRLPNYLRTYRKRACLTQDEVAYLLGTWNGAKVSRYEGFKRRPNVQAVFAYRMIFGVQVRDLFAGEFKKVEQVIKRRTHLLIKRLERGKGNPVIEKKLSKLRSIISNQDTHIIEEDYGPSKSEATTYHCH